MIDLLVGEAGKLPVKFERNGSPLIPDIGSVKFSIRDHAGVVIPGYSQVNVTTGSTTYATSLDIPLAANTIASGKLFERRTVVVTFVNNGVTYVDRYPYRVIPFLPHSVTAQRVRSFIGATANELEDYEIDITSAYFLVSVTVGTDNLNTALTSGTIKEIAANDTILCRTVLDVLPSLRQRIAQEEQSGVKSFKRAQIDFTALQVEAQNRYQDGLTSVLEGLVATVSSTIFAVTQDTDPVTAGQS